jgi:hypothetical protein
MNDVIRDHFRRRAEIAWTRPARAGLIALVALALLAGCDQLQGDDGEDGEDLTAHGNVYADRVIAYDPAYHDEENEDDFGIYDEENILGAPDGATGVTSLSYNPEVDDQEGGSITVGFGDGDDQYCITDGPWMDFVIHENVIQYTAEDETTGNTLARYSTEVAYVEVAGEDGESFYRFPATVPYLPLDIDSVGDPLSYINFAGTLPDGNPFDLADVIASEQLDADFAACYLRIVDAGTVVADDQSDGPFAAFVDWSGADFNAVEALNVLLTEGLAQ